MAFWALNTIFYSQSLFAGASCAHLFDYHFSDKYILDQIEKLELSVSQLKVQAQEDAPSFLYNENFLELIEYVDHITVRALENAEQPISLTTKIERAFNLVLKNKSHIESHKKSYLLNEERKKNKSFEAILANPFLVYPDNLYTIISRTGDLRVSFHEDVVAELFHKPWPEIQKTAKHLLRAMTHGFIGATGTTGIKMINAKNHAHIYEVKIIGHGNKQRLFGYFVSNHFRVVYYSDEHLDGNFLVDRIVDRVNRIKRSETLN